MPVRSEVFTDAMREPIFGKTAADKARNALTARSVNVTSVREVCDEIRRLDPGLAARFWNMMGAPTRVDDVAINGLCADISILEQPRA